MKFDIQSYSYVTIYVKFRKINLFLLYLYESTMEKWS